MVDFLTGWLVLDVKPEDAVKTAMPTPAPVRQPEPEPAAAAAVSAVLARARKSIQQGQRVRRNGPVLVSQVLEGQGLNAPSIGALLGALERCGVCVLALNLSILRIAAGVNELEELT